MLDRLFIYCAYKQSIIRTGLESIYPVINNRFKYYIYFFVISHKKIFFCGSFQNFFKHNEINYPCVF